MSLLAILCIAYLVVGCFNLIVDMIFAMIFGLGDRDIMTPFILVFAWPLPFLFKKLGIF